MTCSIAFRMSLLIFRSCESINVSPANTVASFSCFKVLWKKPGGGSLLTAELIDFGTLGVGGSSCLDRKISGSGKRYGASDILLRNRKQSSNQCGKTILVG